MSNNSEELTQKIVSSSDTHSQVVESSEVKLADNQSIDSLVMQLNKGQDLTQVPIDNTRSNLKIVLVSYAKSRVDRVLKLSRRLEELEDRLYDEVSNKDNPLELKDILAITQLLSQSLNQTLQFIDKVSTTDTYFNITFNDNRQMMNQTLGLINNVTTPDDLKLSRQSREKLRDILEQFVSSSDSPQVVPTTVISQPVSNESEESSMNLKPGMKVIYNNEKFTVVSVNTEEQSVVIQYPGAIKGNVTVPISSVKVEMSEGRITSTANKLNG